MKIRADISNCAGHARCAAVAPSLFELNENGYLDTAEINVPQGEEQLARRAVRSCPERILELVEDEKDKEEARGSSQAGGQTGS